MVTAETYPMLHCVSAQTNFSSIMCQVITDGRFKTKEKFKFLALKVVTVAYMYKRFQILGI